MRDQALLKTSKGRCTNLIFFLFSPLGRYCKVKEHMNMDDSLCLKKVASSSSLSNQGRRRIYFLLLDKNRVALVLTHFLET